MQENYLNSINQSFQYYKLLGDKAIAQLNDQELFYALSEEDNSIAIMVKHLWGNMMSRWTNFLSEDGEKTWRNREEEFELDMNDRKELMARWNEGWSCLFEALASVNEDNFTELVYIRNEGHTIVEACNRQLAHYAYHIGQIVYLSKNIKGKTWESLSIPKGGSEKFNQKKFDQEKRRGNFLDEMLDERNTDF